jgi:hypothetical protein
MAEHWIHMSAPTAKEVAAQFELAPEAKALLNTQTPPQFLAALLDYGHDLDALRFLAYAMPKRHAVYWAWLCVKEMKPKEAPPQEKAPLVTQALDAAHKWVLDPSETNRRACETAYTALGLEHPAAVVAVAAFWSEGSLSPSGNPVVPPPAHLCAHGASSAVMLAAAKGDPAKIKDAYTQAVAQGVGVAAGKLGWNK